MTRADTGGTNGGGRRAGNRDPQSPDARTRLVAGTADLLRRRGFSAASVRESAKHSGAPLGSTYHYFPGGKSELATAAVRYADDLTARALTGHLADGPVEGLRGFIGMWRSLLRDSDFDAGCPVMAMSVDEHPDAAEPRAAAAAAFEGWTARLAAVLAENGAPTDDARRTATLTVAAVEGAVAMCRAERSLRPLDETAQMLEQTVRRVCDGDPRQS